MLCGLDRLSCARVEHVNQEGLVGDRVVGVYVKLSVEFLHVSQYIGFYVSVKPPSMIARVTPLPTSKARGSTKIKALGVPILYRGGYYPLTIGANAKNSAVIDESLPKLYYQAFPLRGGRQITSPSLPLTHRGWVQVLVQG